MNDFINQLTFAVSLIQEHLTFILSLIGLLYIIHFINWILGYRLNILGIFPRHVFSLPGIIFYPFLHGHFNHLFFNTIPLFILASFVLLKGFSIFYCVSITIIILSGLGIWLIGRRGVHIGASGLIMGYWAYLLLDAYQERTVISFAPALVCLYYFGGFLFHIFPSEVKTSWEAHLCGLLAGLAAAYTCPAFFCQWFHAFCSML